MKMKNEGFNLLSFISMSKGSTCLFEKLPNMVGWSSVN